jgi:hypothetical protein
VGSGVGHNETAFWIGICDGGGGGLPRIMYDSQLSLMHQSRRSLKVPFPSLQFESVNSALVN